MENDMSLVANSLDVGRIASTMRGRDGRAESKKKKKSLTSAGNIELINDHQPATSLQSVQESPLDSSASYQFCKPYSSKKKSNKIKHASQEENGARDLSFTLVEVDKSADELTSAVEVKEMHESGLKNVSLQKKTKKIKHVHQEDSGSRDLLSTLVEVDKSADELASVVEVKEMHESGLKNVSSQKKLNKIKHADPEDNGGRDLSSTLVEVDKSADELASIVEVKEMHESGLKNVSSQKKTKEIKHADSEDNVGRDLLSTSVELDKSADELASDVEVKEMQESGLKNLSVQNRRKKIKHADQEDNGGGDLSSNLVEVVKSAAELTSAVEFKEMHGSDLKNVSTQKRSKKIKHADQEGNMGRDFSSTLVEVDRCANELTSVVEVKGMHESCLKNVSTQKKRKKIKHADQEDMDKDLSSNFDEVEKSANELTSDFEVKEMRESGLTNVSTQKNSTKIKHAEQEDNGTRDLSTLVDVDKSTDELTSVVEVKEMHKTGLENVSTQKKSKKIKHADQEDNGVRDLLSSLFEVDKRADELTAVFEVKMTHETGSKNVAALDIPAEQLSKNHLHASRKKRKDLKCTDQEGYTGSGMSSSGLLQEVDHASKCHLQRLQSSKKVYKEGKCADRHEIAGKDSSISGLLQEFQEQNGVGELISVSEVKESEKNGSKSADIEETSVSYLHNVCLPKKKRKEMKRADEQDNNACRDLSNPNFLQEVDRASKHTIHPSKEKRKKVKCADQEDSACKDLSTSGLPQEFQVEKSVDGLTSVVKVEEIAQNDFKNLLLQGVPVDSASTFHLHKLHPAKKKWKDVKCADQDVNVGGDVSNSDFLHEFGFASKDHLNKLRSSKKKRNKVKCSDPEDKVGEDFSSSSLVHEVQVDKSADELTSVGEVKEMHEIRLNNVGTNLVNNNVLPEMNSFNVHVTTNATLVTENLIAKRKSVILENDMESTENGCPNTLSQAAQESPAGGPSSSLLKESSVNKKRKKVRWADEADHVCKDSTYLLCEDQVEKSVDYVTSAYEMRVLHRSQQENVDNVLESASGIHSKKVCSQKKKNKIDRTAHEDEPVNGTSIYNRSFDHISDKDRELGSNSEVELAGCGAILAVCHSEAMNSVVESDANKQEKLTGLLKPLGKEHASHCGKKLLVLDLNGLLVDIVPCQPKWRAPDTKITSKSVYKRPFSDDFLKFCFEKFDVGIWSSRTRKNLEALVDFLMREYKDKLLFVWDQLHCTDTGYTTVDKSDKPLFLKELNKIWNKVVPCLPWEKGEYTKSNTLLVDDSPYKALLNPPYTAIFPRPYNFLVENDNSLGPGGDLRVYLEGLAETYDIPLYVQEHPFGQRAITEANPSWGYYLRVLSSLKRQQDREDADGSWPK